MEENIFTMTEEEFEVLRKNVYALGAVLRHCQEGSLDKIAQEVIVERFTSRHEEALDIMVEIAVRKNIQLSRNKHSAL